MIFRNNKSYVSVRVVNSADTSHWFILSQFGIFRDTILFSIKNRTTYTYTLVESYLH